MLELSRDLADGAHPYLVTSQHTAGAREILGEGPLLVVEQAVAPTSEREEALSARSHLSRYMRLPNYRNSWLRRASARRTSRGTAAIGSRKDWWPGDRERHTQAGERTLLGRRRSGVCSGADG